MIPTKPPKYERECGLCGKVEIRSKPTGRVTCFDCQIQVKRERSLKYKKSFTPEEMAEKQRRMREYPPVDNFTPNGLLCITCKNQLTGMAKKYCSGKCEYMLKRLKNVII